MAGEDWLSGHVVQLLGELGIRKGGDVDVTRVVSGPYVPDMKPPLVVVTPVAGPGDVAEGAATVRGFQVRVEGRPNDSTGTERLARRIHRRIKFAPFPMWVGEVRLISVVASSDPAPLGGGGDDDDSRDTYVSTHQFLVSEFDQEGEI